MDPKSQRPKRRDTTLSSLNTAIEAVNIAKDILSMTPATAALSTVSVILAAIRVGFLLFRFSRLPDECTQDSMMNEEDYVDLVAESPALGFLPKAELSVDGIQRILDKVR